MVVFHLQQKLKDFFTTYPLVIICYSLQLEAMAHRNFVDLLS